MSEDDESVDLREGVQRTEAANRDRVVTEIERAAYLALIEVDAYEHRVAESPRREAADGEFATFTQQRRSRPDDVDGAAPSFDFSTIAAEVTRSNAALALRYDYSSIVTEAARGADGGDSASSDAACGITSKSASNFDYSSIATDGGFDFSSIVTEARDAGGVAAGASDAACSIASKSAASSFDYSSIATEAQRDVGGVAAAASDAACDIASKSASSFDYASIATEARRDVGGVAAAASDAACDIASKSASGFDYSSIATEAQREVDGVAAAASDAACDIASTKSASSFDYLSIATEAQRDVGGVAAAASDATCDIASKSASSFDYSSIATEAARGPNTACVISSLCFDYARIVDEEARELSEKALASFAKAYTTTACAVASISSNVDASIQTGARVAQATAAWLPEGRTQGRLGGAAAGAIADGATAMAMVVSSENANIYAAAADAHSARVQHLYESLGRVTAAAAVATATACTDVASEEASAIAQQHVETASQMVAQNVLLQLECYAARERASELQAELMQMKSRRAEELVNAVRCHDQDSALSALIAAEAEGNIDATFVGMLNSAAQRSTGNRRGHEASDAERAFYTSVFIVSREAARLMSNLCCGPSLDRMEAWVKDYPHLQPGTTVHAITSNLDHAIAVWRRAGVDMLHPGVHVDVYSCDDGTALQCSVNATIHDEQQLGVYGLIDGPYFLTLGELSDDQVMHAGPERARSMIPSHFKSRWQVLDSVLSLITEKGISTSLQLHMLVPQHAELKALPIIMQETNNQITSDEMLRVQRLLLRLWLKKTGKRTLRQSSADGAAFARKTTQRVHMHAKAVADDYLFVLDTDACDPDRDLLDGDAPVISPAGVLHPGVVAANELLHFAERGEHHRVLRFQSVAAAAAATPAALRTRYRQMAKLVHPDNMPPDERELATSSFLQLKFAYGRLAHHPCVSMHAAHFGSFGIHLITSDPMHCRWRLRRQYLRVKVRRGAAILAIGTAQMNPARFATVANAQFGARIREKDMKYCHKQNEVGCFRLAALTRDGARCPDGDYLTRMWEKRAELEGSLDADVAFFIFFQRYTALFTDRTLSMRLRLRFVGFVVCFLALTYQLAQETPNRNVEQNWFTSQTAFDSLATVMLFALRTLLEQSAFSQDVLRAIWRREGSIHAELAFQLLRLLVAPGNTFNSFQAFRVLLRRLVLKRDRGSGGEGDARHGAQQERTVGGAPIEARLTQTQIAAVLSAGMADARSMLNSVRPSGQVDRLRVSDVKEIDVLKRVGPRTAAHITAAELSIAEEPSARREVDEDEEEEEEDDDDEDDAADADGNGPAVGGDGDDDDDSDGGARPRRNPPRQARSARPVDARAAATAARHERELTTEERNELRLQGAVAQLRASGLSDEVDGSAGDGGTTSATDGAGRARLLQKVQRALAQINSHIRKQAAGREHRFNAQHLMFGVETVNGPASFAVRDVVAMVCVARHGRRAAHYADYGMIEEITVASQRGTTDHDRARVVSRRTSGAMVRLHFFRRVPVPADEEDGPNNSRCLLGRSYATTADGRELLTYTPTEPQVQNRWKVEALLCRVAVEHIGDEHRAPVLASQRCVDSIVAELDGGVSIEDAIASGLALLPPP